MKHLLMLLTAVGVAVSFPANAQNHIRADLSIKFIRAVGDYSVGSTFDNTIELHFNEDLQWSTSSPCTKNDRVTIDAANEHIISAAYLAYASGMKVKVNVDSTLPLRSGACEVTYLDIVQ